MLLVRLGSFEAPVLAVPVTEVPAGVAATTLNTGVNVELAPAAIVLLAVQLIVPDVALTAGVMQVQPAGTLGNYRLNEAACSDSWYHEAAIQEAKSKPAWES